MSRAVVLAAVALLALGCSKCGKSGGGSGAPAAGVERVLPQSALGVVVVPELGALGQKVTLIEGLKATSFAAQLQGFADAKELSAALVDQLGLDLRSPEAMALAGVDPAKSAGVAVVLPGFAVLALPVKDETRLHHALSLLANRRLGAGALAEVESGGVKVKTFSPQQGAEPRFAYAVAHGYALIAEGKAMASVALLAALSEKDSLTADKGYGVHLERLPKTRDLIVYAPAGSLLLERTPFKAALGTLSLTAEGLAVHVDGPWKGDAAQLAVLQTKPAQPLSGYLPADAFLVTRFSGEPAALAPFAKQVLGPSLGRALDEGGFDLKTQALDLLEPGSMAALSLAERPPMDRGMPELDLRRTNPFAYVNLSGVARVKPGAPVQQSLDKVITIAPKFGAQMVLKERPDGQKAVLTTYAQGEGVHLAPKGDLVFFASPVNRLDALVKSDGKGALSVAGLGDEALTVAIDLKRLTASIRELPESAWGLGGFAIKATTLRWLDATDDLQAVTLSAGAKDASVQARLLLKLAQPEGAKAP